MAQGLDGYYVLMLSRKTSSMNIQTSWLIVDTSSKKFRKLITFGETLKNVFSNIKESLLINVW